jgi:hypothetical protein
VPAFCATFGSQDSRFSHSVAFGKRLPSLRMSTKQHSMACRQCFQDLEDVSSRFQSTTHLQASNRLSTIMRHRGLPDARTMRWHTSRNKASSRVFLRRTFQSTLGTLDQGRKLNSCVHSCNLSRRAVSCFHPCHRPWLPPLQLRLQYLASAD